MRSSSNWQTLKLLPSDLFKFPLICGKWIAKQFCSIRFYWSRNWLVIRCKESWNIHSSIIRTTILSTCYTLVIDNVKLICKNIFYGVRDSKNSTILCMENITIKNIIFLKLINTQTFNSTVLIVNSLWWRWMYLRTN